jgi:small subunit ribosomal protein S16
MAVRIRLARRGRKKRAIYDVVVADARAPRDGKFIEKLGSFNPNSNPPLIDINVDRALNWVMNGAQPSETTKKLLSVKGVMLKKHLQVGVNKGAITQEVADAKFGAWLTEKENATLSAADLAAKTKAADQKAKLEAEAKVNAARAEEIAKKLIVVEEVEAVAEAVEGAEEVAESPVAEATEEAAVVESPVDEAPVVEAPVAETPAEEGTEEKAAE